MLRVFQQDIFDSQNFLITLELVPGKEAIGRSVDTVISIAKDSFSDGRISAVSLTDNPGGNPSLSPDMIGYEIFKTGIDVIVHFTCRDLNRLGMESRALQLAMMGMKNILALTGDYTGKGFGGQGAPVFDFDSVALLMMLKQLNLRMNTYGDPDGFLTGCAVSPFKRTQAECFSQYAKLYRKLASGAQFVITQLGYDVRKFAELILMLKQMKVNVPVIGSIYVLTPKAAKIMNKGYVPGAVVTDALLKKVKKEWKDPKHGRKMAIERAAKLGAILKAMGYQGIHIGGIHKNFEMAGQILDRIKKIEPFWKEFIKDFNFPMHDGFYVFPDSLPENLLNDISLPNFNQAEENLSFSEKIRFNSMKFFHDRFFSFKSPMAPLYNRICGLIDKTDTARHTFNWLEGSIKNIMLNCQECGDCGIQHLAFLCPESQCPKHTRNGACGGSRYGKCEVYPERDCVWVRTYRRLASKGKNEQMFVRCVPPRMWELNKTSSWLNFHLKRDHQTASSDLKQFCESEQCKIDR